MSYGGGGAAPQHAYAQAPMHGNYPPPPSGTAPAPYSYNTPSYHAAPPSGAAPAPYPYNTPSYQAAPASQHGGDPIMENKVQRLMEMGFERQRVVNALNSAGGDEQRALDSLV